MRGQRPLRVIVVDDDFMIAKVHAGFIESQPGYQVVGTAYHAQQAFDLISECPTDLLLLDVYLPDRSGLDLLGEIRAQKIPCDVILITAAKEVHIVEEGFRLGIFDYLIKPFHLTRLGDALEKYAQYKRRLLTSVSLDQQVVDHLKRMRSLSVSPALTSESGIDQRTLERVQESLKLIDGAGTAEEIAALAGLSRSTARTYLAFLVNQQLATEQLSYGTVGRPRRLFRKT